ncbi:hypothetical protein K9M48_04165 [Candidatus Gracilibacteria bacterium]|nr:hypothetical protein [Candidatus Gracilibacteria bacterium]
MSFNSYRPFKKRSLLPKYLIVFLLGISFALFFSSALNIVTGIENATQYIKQIILTSDGTASGTTGIVLDGVNGRIGIGTDSPQATLQVIGTILGGENNSTSSNYDSFILGGRSNAINDATGAIIVGGLGNYNDGTYSIIGGGEDNEILSSWSAILGGFHNFIYENSINSFIGGGSGNSISGSYSVIGGGRANIVTGELSTIGGGKQNKINGDYSVVPGGNDVRINGDYSFAAGVAIDLNHNNTFVWNSELSTFSSNKDGAFLVNVPEGGAGINTNNPQADLEVNNVFRITPVNIGIIGGTSCTTYATGSIIFANDAAGGSQLCFCNGTDPERKLVADPNFNCQ